LVVVLLVVLLLLLLLLLPPQGRVASVVGRRGAVHEVVVVTK
jgi:hypothetical protein